MQLKDKVAIITGAARGIGLACAQRFVAEGARVVVVDINGEEAVHAAKSLGHGALGLAADIGDAPQVQQLVQEVVSRCGQVNVLVNNAAIIHPADFLDLKIEDFDRVLRVNLRGSFLMAQAAARQMVQQGRGGAIINMSSVNAVMAIPNQTPYVVAKGGLNQLTKVMALSLAPHHIRVNGVGPGSIMTEMLQTVMTDPAARDKILSRTPAGRCGTPEEIANVVLFLASDAASYITGQTIYADGGRLALNYTVPVAE